MFKVIIIFFFFSRTVRRTVISLLILWVVDLLIVSPILFISTTIDLLDNPGSKLAFCVEYFPTILFRRMHTLMIFLFLYVVPVTGIGACYIAMARYLYKQNKRSLARKILYVVFVFAVCWLPFHALNIVREVTHITSPATFHVMTQVGQCLAYLCNVVNPFMYSFMNHTFRKSFKSTMNKWTDNLENDDFQNMRTRTISTSNSSQLAQKVRLIIDMLRISDIRDVPSGSNVKSTSKQHSDMKWKPVHLFVQMAIGSTTS